MIVLMVLVAQLSDAAAFAMATARYEIVGESNPVVVALYLAGGLNTVLIVKLCGAILVAALAYRLRRSPWRFVPVLAGGFGALTGIASLL